MPMTCARNMMLLAAITATLAAVSRAEATIVGCELETNVIGISIDGSGSINQADPGNFDLILDSVRHPPPGPGTLGLGHNCNMQHGGTRWARWMQVSTFIATTSGTAGGGVANDNLYYINAFSSSVYATSAVATNENGSQLDFVQTLPFSGGGTDIAEALEDQLATLELFAPGIVILITDGQSNFAQAAADLALQELELVCVGVGNADVLTLNELCSQVFTAESIGDIAELLEETIVNIGVVHRLFSCPPQTLLLSGTRTVESRHIQFLLHCSCSTTGHWVKERESAMQTQMETGCLTARTPAQQTPSAPSSLVRPSPLHSPAPGLVPTEFAFLCSFPAGGVLALRPALSCAPGSTCSATNMCLYACVCAGDDAFMRMGPRTPTGTYGMEGTYGMAPRELPEPYGGYGMAPVPAYGTYGMAPRELPEPSGAYGMAPRELPEPSGAYGMAPLPTYGAYGSIPHTLPPSGVYGARTLPLGGPFYGALAGAYGSPLSRELPIGGFYGYSDLPELGPYGEAGSYGA